MRRSFRSLLLSLCLVGGACGPSAAPGAASSSASARATASGSAHSSASSPPVASSASGAPSASASVSAPPVEPPPADAVGRFARGTNAFGLELYARLRATPGNLVISPASLSTALAMTWGGAKGETAAQMQKVLGFEGAPAEVLATAGQLTRSLESPARKFTFRAANRLFADKSFELLQPFVEQTQTAFGAGVERLDFHAGPEAARAHINGWVEQKTEQRVKELIPASGINGGTPLVLVNALYFLGNWERPFTKEATRAAAFHLSASEQVQVPTMSQLGPFSYAKQGGLQAVELPYEGGELAMALVLPEGTATLETIERSLDAAKLAALFGALRSERVSLSLPKFELSPRDSLALAAHLPAMGMPDAFDPKKADFTGLSKAALFIGEVFHKGFLKVDEKGTEAAAASAVVMAPSGPAPAPGLELKLDRPFLFFIRDRKSGLILFMGRVSDPSKG